MSVTDDMVKDILDTKRHLVVQLLKEAKPGLNEIDERCAKVGYGAMKLELTVRAGEIEKIAFAEEHTWLRPKKA